jgi:PII-like signaling protein
MNSDQITMVRIYLHEGEAQVKTILKRLRDWEKVRGVTVFRGISGYGDSGEIHSTGIVDLSFDLPVVVEFFDDAEKVHEIIEHLCETVKPGHIVWWNAHVNKS